MEASSLSLLPADLLSCVVAKTTSRVTLRRLRTVCKRMRDAVDWTLPLDVSIRCSEVHGDSGKTRILDRFLQRTTDLRQVSVEGASPEVFESLSRVTGGANTAVSVWLNETTELTPQDMLHRIPRLQVLEVNLLKRDPEGETQKLEAVSLCTQLVTLKLWDRNDENGVEGVQDLGALSRLLLQQDGGGLRVLKLHQFRSLSSLGFVSPGLSSRLRVLTLVRCVNIASLLPLARLTSLRKLVLDDVPDHDMRLADVLSTLSELCVLKIRGEVEAPVSGLHLRGVPAALARLRKLRHLTLMTVLLPDLDCVRQLVAMTQLHDLLLLECRVHNGYEDEDDTRGFAAFPLLKPTDLPPGTDLQVRFQDAPFMLEDCSDDDDDFVVNL